MESLTDKQLRALVAASERDERGQRGLWTVSEIYERADIANYSRSAMRSNLRRLEMRGYLRDVTHRKLQMYQLTREGRKMLKQYAID